MEKLRALFRKYRELIAYVIVGGLTTVVSMALYYGSTWAFLDGSDALQVQIANVIAWIGAVAFAYVTNRVFVFQSHSTAVFREILAGADAAFGHGLHVADGHGDRRGSPHCKARFHGAGDGRQLCHQ